MTDALAVQARRRERIARKVSRRGRSAKHSRWPKAAALLAVGLVAGETLAYGGGLPDVAISFAGLQAMLLLALATTPPERERSPARYGQGFIALAVLFVAVELWAALTLLPLGGGWAAPQWPATGETGAITLDRLGTVREMIKLGGLACLFSAGLWLSARRASGQTLAAVAVCMTAYSAWAIVAFYQSPASLFGVAKAYHQDRLTASFLSANTAGGLFGACGAMFFAMALETLFLSRYDFRLERRLLAFAPWAAAAVACLGALLLTGSRGAIAATALVMACAALAAAAVTAVRSLRQASLRWTALAVVAALAVAGAAAAPYFAHSKLASRLNDGEDGFGGRLDLIPTFYGSIAERFWQGHGLGTFRVIAAGLTTPERFGSLWDIGAAHNIVVQWLLEGGVIGAGLMFATVTLILGMLCRKSVRRSGSARTARAVLAFTVVLVLHNLVDYSLQLAAVAALWALLLGLAAGAVRGESAGRFG